MRDALRTWFDAAARPLPWRSGPGWAARDPYRTLVVETMAQQTRIETVVAREGAFRARFPDLASLAAAELDDVLHEWSGLGYYRRARALHALARSVVVEHGGRLPADPASLRRLPGIGPYTAAAIAAQAFGVPGVAVDGNVRRVGARVLAEPTPTDDRVARGLTDLLLDGATRPGDAFVAEALVELGATVCTPRRPACSACPLRPACRAVAEGAPERYPSPRARAAARPWALHAWLTTRTGPTGVLLAVERRADTGPWAGLHGPPWRDHAPAGGRELGRFVHRLSHRLVEATVWTAPAPPADAQVRWASARERSGLGMAEVDRRALAWVDAVPPGEPDPRSRG
ncbi:MAG: A/G-specific adenine glycosylase [Trueperaceae bacterium]